MSGSTFYRSRVRVEYLKEPLLRAHLPAERKPLLFGLHSQVARHYGVDVRAHEEHAATLDYLVAAAAG